MKYNSRKRLWIGIVVVVVALLAFASPSIIAGLNGTADASSGCSMGNSASNADSSGGGCSMMGGGQGSDTASDKCSMMGSDTGGCSMMGDGSCSMLTGTAVAVNDGSVTVTVKAAPDNDGVANKALSQIKVGDKLAMTMIIGKDGKPVAEMAKVKAPAGKYVCPMHPNVTSNKPGKCPKCGMNLQKVVKGRK